MRVFANDEIETALQFLPRAAECSSLVDFKSLLEQELPYNSQETRQRRASYILDRYYPAGSIDTSLTAYAQNFQSGDGLKSVVFYQLAQAEPILAKAADEFIFPALPLGKISRDSLRDFILGYLPEIKAASQAKVLRSIFYAYTWLGVGRTDGEYLKFQLHPGNQDAFAYILTSEYPEPGIYSFDNLYDGPAHHWLLWDREWIRKQLYVLRDIGVVSKVSEIDTVKQFSLEFGQQEFLTRYYQNTLKKSGRDTEL
jgi:DNA repair protein RadC